MFNENAGFYNCDGKKQHSTSTKGTQTNQVTDLELFEFVLLTKDLVLSDKSKIIYALTLEYINKFHNLLNKQIINCSDMNYGPFKIPEVPNYSFLSDLIINSFNGAGNNSKEHDLENYTQDNTNTQISNENAESVKIEIVQKFEEEKCKLEYEVNNKTLNLEDHEKEYHGASNPIFSAIACKKDNPVVTMNVLVDRHLEECEVISRIHDEGDAKTNFTTLLGQKESPSCLQRSKQSLQDRKSTKKSSNSDIKQKLVGSVFNIISIEPQSESHESKHQDYNRDSDYSISDDQEDPLPIKIVETLNEKKVKKGRPENPSKVLEMFDRISRQNLLAKQLSLLQDDLSLKNESIRQENSTREENSCSFSGSDSDILDDEDFNILSKNRTYIKDPQIFQENYSGGCQERSHPLQLTGKDLCNMSQKMINAIGLFTANGEIKPAVLNLLEQQKKVRQTDHKKQQFRNTRPINTNVYLKPKPGP